MSRFLVTGGTGTIGRMVCRKLYANGNDVVVLSRDHSKQLVNCPKMFHEVGRIEDEHFVQHVMRKYNIDGVIHTAANKHIGVCEDKPSEAVSANVLGSLNILKAMESNGVHKGIFVSSDKACNHDHVYGMTKYLMERLVSEYSERIRPVNCVRFGNVFGSSGSVIPIWRAKISRGQDIDLRVFENGIVPTRMAMLPSDASDFLLDIFDGQGAYENGTVLMPGRCQVVSLLTLAEVMTEGTKSKIHMVPALKMEAQNERMFSPSEADRIVRCGHRGILELTSRPQGEGRSILGNDNSLDHERTREFLKAVIEESKEWI